MIERRTVSNRIFDAFNVILLFLIGLICLYPMVHVLFGSFSHPKELLNHTGPLLRPMGFITRGYEIVFANPNIWVSYGNTIFYVVVGTAARMFMTLLGAYVLAQDSFMLRKPMMIIFVFTMYFSGGLIPDFLLVSKLGMLNTRAAIYLPGRRDLHPLQLILREILISHSASGNVINQSLEFVDQDAVEGLIEDVVRYCTICIATVPILCVYPFVQKHFVRGVMMGSLKE
ncbi:MAG: hypothetical protein WBL14_12755 [Caldicoprobacterales bacterium]